MTKMDAVNCDKVLQQLGQIQQCEKKWTTVPNDQKERTFELLYFYGLIKDIKNDEGKEIIALTKNGGKLFLEYDQSIKNYLNDRKKELGLDVIKEENRIWRIFKDAIAIIGVFGTIYFSWLSAQSKTERVPVSPVEPKGITAQTKDSTYNKNN